MSMLSKINKVYNESNILEKYKARLGLGTQLQKNLKANFKIGMAITAYERPEYLEICLDSLFKTNLHNYNITFLLQDDGSKDPRVAEIINKERDPKYKIVRYFTSKGPNNAGAAINKAVNKLMEMDDFDIIGWADADALFHPEWLDQTLKVCLWAKQNHKDHILGPFTSFNSSDFVFHRILGSYESPTGNYVVKRQAGMLNYFYFKEDFEKLGFFEENKDDETLMTEKFQHLQIRNLCTETSWIEHIGQSSILNQWRPTPITNAVHAIHPAQGMWGEYDIHKFRNHPLYYYQDIEREYNRTIYNINSLRKRKLGEKLFELSSKVVEIIYDKIAQWIRGQIAIRKVIRNLNDIKKTYAVETHSSQITLAKSDMKIDLVIPVLEKDMIVLPYVINSIRKYINHPVGEIKILSPESEKLREFCNNNRCMFVNEDDVLPIKMKDIDYKVDGVNRAGWLFQQLLKLSGPLISSENNYAVLDADTIFLKPFTFEHNGKYIFDMADEYNLAYFHTYVKLLGFELASPLSFIAHHMIINQEILQEMKDLIEKQHNKKWYEAIIDVTDKSIQSGFSEFETYGNFMFNKYRSKMIMEYWYNVPYGRNKFHAVEKFIKQYKKTHKTLSFQSYHLD